MDLISRHSLDWFLVFGCNIVPKDSFLDGTVHPGCNSFHNAVTTCCYTIHCWSIHITKPQVNSPLMCKSSKFSAVGLAWRIPPPAGESQWLNLVLLTASKLKTSNGHSLLASKNKGHHSVWYPSLVSASSCLPPAFLSPSELVLGLSTGIPHIPTWLT